MNLTAAVHPLAAAGESAPAGGSPIVQIVIATLAAGIILTVLIALGLARRSGRFAAFDRVEAFASRMSGGLPAWSAIASAVAAVSLLCAVFGLYWDVSLHIDNGRDEGPLANPSHYSILAGLLGIFAAGWLAVVLPRERPGPIAVKLTRDWYAPVGGLVLMACASFAALGFPLDDFWHRLFGQDVTLWGPTHLMMLSGAALSLIGILVVLVEGRLAAGAERARAAGDPSGGDPGPDAPLVGEARRGRPSPAALLTSPRARTVSACGGLLVGLSIYQAEFDFGVPQFSLLYHPVLIAAAASIALVAARLIGGRGAALATAGFFIALRGVLALLVGPGLGEALPHFPLFLAEALLVELIAWQANPDRPYRMAVVAGTAIGTLGVLAEYGWSKLWMPIEWPAQIVPEAIVASLLVSVAGAILGAFVASALRRRSAAGGSGAAVAAAAVSVAVIAAVLAMINPTTAPERATAAVTLTQATGGPTRTVDATVRLEPAGLARDADWLHTLAYQGGEPLRIAPLERVSESVYRTTQPLPVGGSWKTLIRFHRGDQMAIVPVYLPADPELGEPEIPAPATFERAFVADKQYLQRERKDDVPAWLWTLGNAVVAACTATLLALIGWALRRLALSGAAPPTRTRERRRTATSHAPVAAGAR